MAETVSEEAQVSDLVGKDFETTFLSMLEWWKENMDKELKQRKTNEENLKTVSQGWVDVIEPDSKGENVNEVYVWYTYLSCLVFGLSSKEDIPLWMDRYPITWDNCGRVCTMAFMS